ncbi:MAG: PrsW family glutamic-type intramembrane protease, partial [Anaerolineae bacterium]
GVALGSGAIRIVLTTLAHAAFAGVTGYFLGRQKFEQRPLWWMPAGVLTAAALNSLFFFFRGMVSQGSLSDNGGMARPWIGLGLAVVLTTVITVFLSRTIHRDIQALLAAEEG